MAVHDTLPERLPDTADAQRTMIEQAARTALGAQRTTLDPDEAPARSTPHMAGHWPIRFPDLDTLRSAAAAETTLEQESNKSAGIAALSADPTVPGRADAADGASDTGTVSENLIALKEALRLLSAVNRSVTRDVFAQAAADPTRASEFEEIRQAIIAKTTAIRKKALHVPE